MGLLKLRNNTKTILFIDSMNLRMAPAKGDNDFVLVDETKVSSDPQIAKCILTGMVSKFSMDEDMSKEKEKKVEKKQEEEIEGRVSQPAKKNTSAAKEKKQQKKYFDDDVIEPKNTDPVVFAGKDADGKYRVEKAPTINQSSLPMPDFIKKEDITDLTMDDLDNEHQGEDDIIYANKK
jgi:hypothetical protein